MKPHNAAGMLAEPPVSAATATSAMRLLAGTVASDDEPPGMRRAIAPVLYRRRT